MGRIIKSAEVHAQNNTMVMALMTKNTTLEEKLPTISDFENDSQLESNLWNGLKTQLGAHKAVIQGLICANDEVINDSMEFSNCVGDEELDEDLIRGEIDNIDADISRIEDLIASLQTEIQAISSHLLSSFALSGLIKDRQDKIQNCLSYLEKGISISKDKGNPISLLYDSFLFTENPCFSEKKDKSTKIEIQLYNTTLDELIHFLIPKDADPFHDNGTIIYEGKTINSVDEFMALYNQK